MKTIPFFALALFFGLTAFGQDPLTRGEVYDFDLGDHFEYRGETNDQPPNATRQTVVDKYFSTDHDTVFYVFHYNNYDMIINTDPVEYFTQNYIDTVWYTNLDQNISDQWLPFDTTLLFATNLIYFDESLCGAETNGYEIHTSEFEPTIRIEKYASGLGYTRRYIKHTAETPPEEVDYSLFYYSKVNGIECGIPDSTLLTDAGNPDPMDPIFIYPNPARKNFYLNAPGVHGAGVAIHDLSGRVVYRGIINDETTHISTAGFAPGMYFVHVKDEYGTAVKKIVVE